MEKVIFLNCEYFIFYVKMRQNNAEYTNRIFHFNKWMNFFKKFSFKN